MKILVIGCGFMGLHLVQRLLDTEHSVSVLDRNQPTLTRGDLDWYTGDCRDKSLLQTALEGVDVLYHMVSSTVPADTEVNPSVEFSDNIFGMLLLTKACVTSGVKKIIFTSSASVYGQQSSFPIREDATLWPISFHAIHKITIEKVLWLNQFESGIESRIARISNPYGPGQKFSGKQGIIGLSIGALLNGTELQVRGNGEMIRDFIHVMDVAEALFLYGTAVSAPPVLNISSGKGQSIRDVLDLIETLTGSVLRINNLPVQPIDISTSVLDNSLLVKHLGFCEKFTLRTGLSHTLEHASLLCNEFSVRSDD